jgi:hypothetical protein
MRSKKYFLNVCCLALICFCFTLCSPSSAKQETPLSEKQFEEAIFQLYLFDGLYNRKANTSRIEDLLIPSNTDSIMEKHGFTKDGLLETYHYYTKHEEKLIAIYDSVLVRYSTYKEVVRADTAKYHNPFK